ncbi:MAG TPA: peptide ABC transporter substrate-binding protein [Candidatus Paceibacterota bacterium]|nr:peptide ABC transporter substrate-binding protein [Candidatus Paceibacterota bacterium]
MSTFWRLLNKPVYLPLIDKLEDLYRAFSPSGRALFLFFSWTLVISAGFLTYTLNNRLLTAVPGYGGELTEGIIGSPRFINPVLAVSDADGDLSALVYSGLLRPGANGDYLPNLASSYSISEDGKTYTFNIDPNARFSDGTPVTADDVVFTVEKIQDPTLKSPLRASWSGVAVEEVDPRTVRFTLSTSYAPFIENVTVGILPKHLWQNVSDEEFPFSELNTSPVGSGPFKVQSISRTQSGIPASYVLAPFNKYLPGQPYLSKITIKFYQSEDQVVSALKSGQIESASGLSPADLPQVSGNTVVESPLNRVFGVFFNQNQSEVLRDANVRAALDGAIDRQALIKNVLGGYGVPLTGPLPPSIFESGATTSSGEPQGVDAAKAYLLAHGWTMGSDNVLSKTTGTGKSAKTTRLSFSISTGNVPELRAAAEYLREQWQAMGADVDVKIFDQGDLSQNVIRPRKYDALLFGEVVGREADLYAFWDSSQRNDPGLNVALYANSAVDDALKSLRETSDDSQRAALYQTIESELSKDIPAVFLYAPDFVYSVPNDIKGLDLGFIETPSDRFASVASWHRETDYVWPLFVKQ